MNHSKVEAKIAGRTLTLETGKWAKLAEAAVLATYGGTSVLTTIQNAKAREGIDFFPLTVDYREKTYAAGKFPGGFFKREARPTTKEILTCRLIDRPMRPMFPDGYKEEVQVMATTLAVDHDVDPDTVAMIAAFAAVWISSIPFEAPMGAVRMGYVDEKVVTFPSVSQVRSGESELNLTMAASKDAVTMVEAGATGLSEDVMLDALEEGHNVCKDIIGLIEKLAKKAGKDKFDFDAPARDETVDKEVRRKYFKKIQTAVSSEGSKQERGAAVDLVKKEAVEFYEKKWAKLEDKELAAKLKYMKGVFGDLKKEAERTAILGGRRTDGRAHDEIRKITIETGVFERLHGSCVFTRGETQALVTTTLGTVDDEQIVDGLEDEVRRKFMLHYNFPPFSVGECRPIRGPGRREIGHGALAERALEAVLPPAEEFPYTIRLVSEILESNGSSSMASVCGGCLALMDAGVPIKQPVAGIAMGLVKEGRKTAILSDIQGSEDHCGDMDFKVTGTQHGITALQMDIKCKGLTRALLQKALKQAKEGRIHILKKMLSALRRPRNELSQHAPRLEQLKINPEKIGIVIGPGGKHIRSLQEETKTKINVTDDGKVIVAGLDAALVETALNRIRDITAEVEVGTTYTGKVVAIKEFGAFLEILPGQEGLCHVSELSNEFIRSVDEVCNIGDEIEVKVLDVDPLGKIKLSRKALLEGGGDQSTSGRGRPRSRDEGDDERPARGRRPSSSRDSEDERPRRGRSRPGRDGDDDRPRRSSRRDEEGDDRPRRSSRRDEEGEDRPRRSSRRDEESQDRPRRSSRRDEEGEDRPRRSRRRDEEDEDRPRRSRNRDDDEEDRGGRPRGRGHGRDEGEDRPRRSRYRDDEDESSRRGRGRDGEDEDRPRRSRRRDEYSDDRPRRSRGRHEDEDRSKRSKRSEDDEGRKGGRGSRSRSRDDESDEAPRRGSSSRSSEDEDRPSRSRGRDNDEDRPRRGRSESRGRARSRR